MKLFINFSFVLLFIATSFANNITNNLIKLPKHFKTEKTFSGDLNDNESFHLIFSKNKQNKMYTIHPFLFNGKEITEINPFENNEELNIISFHKKNNILTLLLSYKEKKKDFLKRVNINLITKKITESTPTNHEDFSAVIRNKNNSILLYKEDDKISINKYDGDDKKEDYSFELKKYSPYEDFFKNEGINPIKNDEFIANGSVASLRVYFEDNKLIFTKDDYKKNYTKLFSFNLDSKENNQLSSIEKHYIYTKENLKKLTSFYKNKKLYLFGNNKKNGIIKIYDLKSNNSKDINLDASLISKIQGNDNFEGFKDFLKQAGKNKHKTTITANATTNNNIKVRVDYVDANYSYNYNWWWHHQQFMMMQHQMMMRQVNFSTPGGFGPVQPNDFHFKSYLIKKEKRYFELVINQNNDLLDTNEETIYKEINKEKYIDKLEDISDLKKESSCFLKDSFRYIGYSRTLKAFTIMTNKLK